MDKRSRIVKTVIAIAVVLASILLIGGFTTGADVMYHLKDRSAIGPLTRDDIEYLTVDAPAATSHDGTVNAMDWAAVYPEISFTMKENSENSYVVDYLEQDPYLVNIYEGYGFAKDYGSARGHEYCLEDVNKTQRPHAKANCLTCKTPNFTKLVNDLGVSVYSMPFEDANALMEESVSCYTCHGNDAGNKGQIVITHSYVTKALGDNASTIDQSTLSCGQCHIEYYFTPSESETMMPYSSVDTMTPEAILDYYNNYEMPDGSIGYYDWIQESTGAKMLKAQHPEMETYLSGVHASMLNCADCHMVITQEEDGTVYHSHLLESPLDNPDLLSKCAECHGDTDMVTMVHKLQDRITARETEVGNKLAEFNDELAFVVASEALDEEALNEVRQLYREAQWYFDFCYVENAEGAHNSELATRCLDKSEELITQGMELLGK